MLKSQDASLDAVALLALEVLLLELEGNHHCWADHPLAVVLVT